MDIAREAGLTAPVIYGGVERQKYILETTGTGVAVFDFDKDGRPDIFLVNGNRLDLPAIPSLLRNQGASEKKNWVILSLEGDRSNRNAIGAQVRVTAGGRTQADEVRSASSYYSSNGLRLHFGLNMATEVERIEILWPSGARQVLRNVNVNRVVSIHELRGIS